jgi:hypothetical protein
MKLRSGKLIYSCKYKPRPEVIQIDIVDCNNIYVVYENY